MTAVTYTAQRSLSPGHSQGESFNIRLRCRAIDPDRDIEKTTTRSMSGNASETVTLRNKRVRKVTTAAVCDTEREEVLEFLDSISQGESFTFDEFGHIGSPHAPFTAIMDGDYREVRAIMKGDGGQHDYFRYTFTLVEQ